MRTMLVLAMLIAAIPAVAAPKPPAPPTIAPAAMYATAPTTHQNQFSCAASPDATTTSSTNMYKVAGSCPATLTLSSFTKLQTGLPNACTSADTAVSPGQTNSYVFTATVGGLESGPSSCVTLTTPAFSPGSLQGTAY